MTDVFEKMLYLAGAGARGISAEVEVDDCIEKLRELSLRYSIWPIVYLGLPERYQFLYQTEVLSIVSGNIKRNIFAIKVINEIKHNGIDVLVLKGTSVASLYNNPEFRVSGDVDLLIPIRHEKKVMNLLKKMGFTVYNREHNSQHFLATHPRAGLIEVHISLHDGSAREFLYEDRPVDFSSSKDFQYLEYKLQTLDIDTGLQHLWIHYIRHFVSEGVGIRQVLDFLIYLERYYNQIDLNKFMQLLDAYNYKELFLTLTAVGNKYFGFKFPVCSSEKMIELLDDIECGGTFGDKLNAQVYRIYQERKCESSGDAHKRYLVFKKIRHIRNEIFPPSVVMRTYGYQYAKNMPLLWISYVHRFMNILVRVLRGKSLTNINDTENNDNIDRRIKLMQDLGMIE